MPGPPATTTTASSMSSPFGLPRRPTSLKPRRALLVVDCQEAFLRPKGPMPGTEQLTKQIAVNIKKLLPSFRRSGGDVLWIKTEHKENRESRTAEKSAHALELQDKLGLLSADICSDDGGSDTGIRTPLSPGEPSGMERIDAEDGGPPTFADPDAFLGGRFMSENKGFLKAGSDDAAFIPEISKFIDVKDRTITKTCYSAFEEGNLVLALRSRMVTELYIAGANTNSSIFATISDASRYGFNMWVLSDCVSYPNAERHENACNMMKNNFGVEQLRTVELLIKVVEGKGEHKDETAAAVVGEEMITNPTVDDETLEKLVESLKINENPEAGDEKEEQKQEPRRPQGRLITSQADITARLKALELEVETDEEDDEDDEESRAELELLTLQATARSIKSRILERASSALHVSKQSAAAKQKPSSETIPVAKSDNKPTKEAADNKTASKDQKDLTKPIAEVTITAASAGLKKEVAKEPDKDKAASKPLAAPPSVPPSKEAVSSKDLVAKENEGTTAAATSPAKEASANANSNATAATATPPRQDQAKPTPQRVERKQIVVRRRISIKKPEPSSVPTPKTASVGAGGKNTTPTAAMTQTTAIATADSPANKKVKPSDMEGSGNPEISKARTEPKTADKASSNDTLEKKTEDSQTGTNNLKPEASKSSAAESTKQLPVNGVMDVKSAGQDSSPVTNREGKDSSAKTLPESTKEQDKETSEEQQSNDNKEDSKSLEETTETVTMPKRESASESAQGNNSNMAPRKKKKNDIPGTFVGPDDLIGEPDDGSSIIEDILPPELVVDAFEKLKEEVRWRVMYHRGGEVPRLVAVEGEISEDGSFPIYRHPADESPPLLPFSKTVSEIRKHVEKALGHPVNHVLIQYYRGGLDYISEHSDKTLDIAHGSYICNVSLGAQRVMTLRTKKPYRPHEERNAPPSDEAVTAALKAAAQAEEEQRNIQRVKLLHNSLFVLGLVTNRKWTHAIKQDRRPKHLKTEPELAYNGERISLTFRQIGTFLSKDETKIWGQGATNKEKSAAGDTICGNRDKSHEMIYAFAAENANPDFVWNETYGAGFDVLHFAPQMPKMYTLAAADESNPVEFMRTHPSSLSIKLALAELGLSYHEQALKMSDLSDKHFAEVSPRQRTPVFVDVDPGRTVVIGEPAILTYLASTNRPGNAQQPSSLDRYTQLLPDPKKDQCEFGRVLSGFAELPGFWELTQKINAFPLTGSWAKAESIRPEVLEEAKHELATWNKYFWKKAPAGGTSVDERAFTIFDCALVPLLAYMLTELGANVDISEYETLKLYLESVRARESVRKVLGEDVFDFNKETTPAVTVVGDTKDAKAEAVVPETKQALPGELPTSTMKEPNQEKETAPTSATGSSTATDDGAAEGDGGGVKLSL